MSMNELELTPLMYLKRQPKLYDLHTHLMGMGSANFWIDTIILNPSMMPDNDTFKDSQNGNLREQLCPLVWDQEGQKGFVDGKESAKFFNELVTRNMLPCTPSVNENEQLQSMDLNYSPALTRLVKNEELNSELLYRRLCFADHFSYDVVLKLTDLGHALGIEETYWDFIQAAVSERLGLYPTHAVKRQRKDEKIRFRYWIIFNAREQCFAVVYGILLSELRSLIAYDPSGPTEAQKAARAHIQNAFSMCNADGSQARHVDLHGFQGAFTPKFYPQRFALKDSIYSQRLDVLARLIEHIIERYTTCLPPIRYCEFSVSVRDLSRPWIYDVLRSVQFHKRSEISIPQLSTSSKFYTPTEEVSSFWQLVYAGCFPHLNFAAETNECPSTYEFTYKFLLGFDRQQTILPTSHIDARGVSKKALALTLLHDYPQHAICLMMNEMIKSVNDEAPETDEPFKEQVNKLTNLQKIDTFMPNYYHWIVGIDLFGDELGYPYCPFVTRPFIDFVKKRRESNKNFGVRVHCGENVPFSPADAPAYRLFITHMYIAFLCLRFLKQELEYGIRIGHGIAFDRLLEEGDDEKMCRKSSVLRAEMRHHARQLFEAIGFEVNITSNEYLLGQTLRNAQDARILCLDTLNKLGAPVFLATDDDGIWPIDNCPSKHPGHQSLCAEYCRAILTGLIKSTEQLKKMLDDTRKFCFAHDKAHVDEPKPQHKENFLKRTSSQCPFVIHPDIVQRIRSLYIAKGIAIHPAFMRITFDEEQRPVPWDSLYGVLRVAFICIRDAYQRIELGPPTIGITELLREEYKNLFGGDNVELEYAELMKNWETIAANFIYLDLSRNNQENRKKYQQIFVALGNDPRIYFYSPAVDMSLHVQPHQDLCSFLNSVRHCEVTVNAYMPHNDSSSLVNQLNDDRQARGRDEKNRTLEVNLYTNRDKEVYIYHTHTKHVILNINARRSDDAPKNGNFIYTIALHGSAATAALHCLAEKIKEKYSTGNDFPPYIPPEDDISSSDDIGVQVSDAVEAALEASSAPNADIRRLIDLEGIMELSTTASRLQ